LQQVTKLHFARFEFKYILHKKLRDEVESELQYFMGFDPFVEDKPDYRYFVRSLYFDDPAFSCYYDKTDGLRTRSKFRLRTYTETPEDTIVPRFLEIKGRHNNLVYKHRVQCDLNGNQAHIAGDQLSRKIIANTDPAPVANQFQYELYLKQLTPVVLIDYLRRPYISKYDPEFRLTFDEELRGTSTARLFPTSTETGRAILPGYTIMEVKFRYHVPSWFHRIIQSFELQRVSISKMCKGVEICGLAKNLE